MKKPNISSWITELYSLVLSYNFKGILKKMCLFIAVQVEEEKCPAAAQ